MNTISNIDYVYILGASHSGSTLLALLLNAHPDIVTIGETAPGKMGDINTYRCSCGELIKDCPFWASVTRRMQHRHPDFRLERFGTKFEFPGNPIIDRLVGCEHRGALLEFLRDTILRLSPQWNQAQDRIAERCYNLASAVLAENEARILVDSSKLAHRLKFILRIPEFNIRVIHLVRDGRAVALTYMKQDEFADAKESHLRRGGCGMSEEPTAASIPMEKAAREWYRCLRSAEHVLASVDRSRWIRVKYEELCHDPEATLRKIHAFLGINPIDTTKFFRQVDHHVIGNGMRLDTTSRICLDERWRSVLTENDLRIFDDVIGRMNRRYGYLCRE